MALHTIQTSGYQILLGDIFSQLDEYLRKYDYSQYLVFLDDNTCEYCFPVLLEKLPEWAEVFQPVVIKSGEEQKNLETCRSLWHKMTSAGADRNTLVINLSGGVLSDMGGFVASTYKRGVHFINLPTTLLSMVDASVGGKLGIDFYGLKNHIGLFANPHGVFIYPGFLKTLPNRELLSGFAEVVKHSLIADKDYFKRISQFGDPNTFTEEQWEKMIASSVEIKKQVVEKDPREAGLRKVLNFGHSLGHAVESWSFSSNWPLLHGEAIAAGMIMELYLSTLKTGLTQSQLDQLTNYLLNTFPYYDEFVNSNAKDILEFIKQDKKNRSHRTLMTLLRETGDAEYDIDVSDFEVLEAIAFYKNLKKEI